MQEPFPYLWWTGIGLIAVVASGFAADFPRRFRLLSDFSRRAGWDTMLLDLLNFAEGPHCLVLAQFVLTPIAIAAEQGTLRAAPRTLALAILATSALVFLPPLLLPRLRLRPYLSALLAMCALALHWPVAAFWFGVAALLLSIGYEMHVQQIISNMTDPSRDHLTTALTAALAGTAGASGFAYCVSSASAIAPTAGLVFLFLFIPPFLATLGCLPRLILHLWAAPFQLLAFIPILPRLARRSFPTRNG